VLDRGYAYSSEKTAPAVSEQGTGRGSRLKLFPDLIKRAKVAGYSPAQFADGLTSTLVYGGHYVPVHRVVRVSPTVLAYVGADIFRHEIYVGEEFLEDSRVCLWVLLQSVFEANDKVAMDNLMMITQCLLVYVRLKRLVIIW
jgi:hypothetical protein